MARAIERDPIPDIFPVADAYRAGLRWDHLQTKRWVRMARGQYASADIPRDSILALQAAEQRMPRESAFSGYTAAWLFHPDIAPSDPIEVTVPRDVPVRARAGIRLRRAHLPESDVDICRGFRTTSPLRTACDLGSRRDVVESVVALDLMLHAGLVQHADLVHHVESNHGAKGIKRLRRALQLAEPKAESPMETRLRLELLRARLPRPEAQVDLYDASGQFLGRADLYYPDHRLVIEYDGENHNDRLVADLKRQNALVNAGYTLLRFTAADLRVKGSAAVQVRRVRSRLAKKLG